MSWVLRWLIYCGKGESEEKREKNQDTGRAKQKADTDSGSLFETLICTNSDNGESDSLEEINLGLISPLSQTLLKPIWQIPRVHLSLNWQMRPTKPTFPT